VCKRASSGIAISKAVKEFSLKSKEVPVNFQIEVIYYGCDLKPQISQNGMRKISESFPKQPNSKIIGAIGRLVQQKNYPTLLQAFALSLQQNKDIHLVVVGDGDSKQELTNFSKRLKIDKKITWLGRTEYIPEFLSRIDIFVLPSVYEGFGLVLLEAMVAKKAILASNNSSIPEVLGSNHKGLFETNNYKDLSYKINKVLQESKFEREVKKNYGKQLVLFDPAKMAKKISRVYEESIYV
jgi:glycosyltransferase involved in cell wall biosynthesis